MADTYWHKQTVTLPLFPNMEWSRPQTKMTAGKLLIVGGNAHSFSAVATAYQAAEKAGIGMTRMVLPDSLRKIVGKTFIAGDFAPSTPSGSFAQNGLMELLTMAQWADSVLFAGDLGRNSETAILLEKFLSKFNGQVTITQDAGDYIVQAPHLVLERSKTTLVLSFAQLQKFATQAHFTTAFTFDMDFMHMIEALHNFTLQHDVQLVVKHLENIFVAVDGEVSSTKLDDDKKIWRVPTAASVSVWWLQNPSKPFVALTAAVLQ